MGKPLNERRKAYLRNVIEQGDRIEKLLRHTGDIVESDEEALE